MEQPEEASSPLTPELAVAQMRSQHEKERRVWTATTRGIRLLVFGLALGVGSFAGGVFLPPEWYAWVATPLGIVGGLLVVAGLLLLGTAFAIGRR
jgi:hypothetical protein